MSFHSPLTRFVRPVIVAVALASGAAASAEAASPYTTVCTGGTCLYHAHQLRSGVLSFYVGVLNASPITHFNVRYRTARGDEVQREIAAAFPILGKISAMSSFNLKPGGRYTISIQACYKRFLSTSTCSSWRAVKFTAPS